MKPVVMYSTRVCPYCVRAEMLLKQRGVVSLEKILVDLLPDEKNKMIERTGRRTVPQIFIGDVYVGGCDDLYELDHKGELVKLLSGD
jgi:glutaredoxin 3